MKHLVPHARQEMAAKGMQPLFSWDNNKIQKYADVSKMGLTRADVLPLSPYSPDMHKPIEHYWNHLKHNVQQRLVQPRAQPLSAAEAIAMVEAEMRAIETMGIFKDVCSLPVTYFVNLAPKGVVAKGPDGQFHTGSGGDWPAPQYC